MIYTAKWPVGAAASVEGYESEIHCRAGGRRTQAKPVVMYTCYAARRWVCPWWALALVPKKDLASGTGCTNSRILRVATAYHSAWKAQRQCFFSVSRGSLLRWPRRPAATWRWRRTRSLLPLPRFPSTSHSPSCNIHLHALSQHRGTEPREGMPYR